LNQKQIKQLEAKLWDSANTLRATSKLTAAEYKDPVLGLILLRYAQNRFEQAKAIIEKKLIDIYAVDCIVSVGNNFFYTRSLPCHVWFLDKGKRPENSEHDAA
jgi:type I restriction-modification system DNA methylase subunit